MGIVRYGFRRRGEIGNPAPLCCLGGSVITGERAFPFFPGRAVEDRLFGKGGMMKEKRIGILMLCCMLAVALSLMAAPCRAADTAKTYTLTITDNISDKLDDTSQYPGGKSVFLYFPDTSLNEAFKEWEGIDGLTIVDGNKYSPALTFIMPERDITLKAIFHTVNYTLTNNITDYVKTGTVPIGRTQVFTRPVIHGTGADNVRFWMWEGTDGLDIVENNADAISVIIPSHDFTLKALFTRFDDVLPNAYYFDPVLWAVEKGVTNGTTDTTFSPGNTCTTANILTFLWRANGSPAPSVANPFSDVPSGSYYEKAAVWAYEKGMVSGNAFKGADACTRAATMKYLWILAGRPESGNPPFTDVSASADYAKAVAWAVAQGVTKGTSDTTFSPNDTCTRGQIVTFLYRHYAQ